MQKTNYSRQQGFTLAELLIASFVALISLLVIGQVTILSDRQHRSTVGTSDAQTTGALALFTLERDARMAGYGIVNSNSLGCTPVQYYYNPGAGNCTTPCYSKPANPASTYPDLTLAPIVIENGAGTAPDALTFTYSNPTQRVIPGVLDETMPNASAELKLQDASGFYVDDMIIVHTPGTTNCSLMQVTQVQLASAQKLQHNAGASAPYNPVGGTSLYPAYQKGAIVYNLGRPIMRRYDISSNQLRLTEMFTYATPSSLPAFNTTPQVLYEQVVDLQAQYGKDTNADGVADTWDNTTPVNAAGWIQVVSVRIGLLVRSKDLEKQEAGACTATTTTPTWAGGNLTVPGGLPSCYKYRVFQTTVPLRNMIWRET